MNGHGGITDKLHRFFSADLGNVVVSLWPECRKHEEAAHLLMRIAWLGALRVCQPCYRELVCVLNRCTRVQPAGLLTRDEKSKKLYAEFVLAERSTLPGAMVRDALMDLFHCIGVGDLLAIWIYRYRRRPSRVSILSGRSALGGESALGI